MAPENKQIIQYKKADAIGSLIFNFINFITCSDTFISEANKQTVKAQIQDISQHEEVAILFKGAINALVAHQGYTTECYKPIILVYAKADEAALQKSHREGLSKSQVIDFQKNYTQGKVCPDWLKPDTYGGEGFLITSMSIVVLNGFNEYITRTLIHEFIHLVAETIWRRGGNVHEPDKFARDVIFPFLKELPDHDKASALPKHLTETNLSEELFKFLPEGKLDNYLSCFKALSMLEALPHKSFNNKNIESIFSYGQYKCADVDFYVCRAFGFHYTSAEMTSEFVAYAGAYMLMQTSNGDSVTPLLQPFKEWWSSTFIPSMKAHIAAHPEVPVIGMYESTLSI